jgi:predicted GIY-YIG superfamily endonuclease
MSDWSCYLLKSTTNSCTYIGATNNTEKRLNTHNRGKGAKYTKGDTWEYVLYITGFKNKQSCLSFESGWKKLCKCRSNKKLKNANIKLSYGNTSGTRRNRITDLMYFVCRYKYIQNKFVMNSKIIDNDNYNSEYCELTINIASKQWIHQLNWPDHIRTDNI